MVECTGLENRSTRKGTVGSNPTLSAKSICFIRVLAGFVNNYHIGYHKTLDVDLDRGIFS